MAMRSGLHRYVGELVWGALLEVFLRLRQGAPVLPGLHRWREVYMMTARRNGGEPDAGLYLKKWMNSAPEMADRLGGLVAGDGT